MTTQALSPRQRLKNPVGQADTKNQVLAPRPTALDGKTLAIVDNGKEGANIFLGRVQQRLKERFKFADVIYVRKNRSGMPCSNIDEVAKKADIVVTGLGI